MFRIRLTILALLAFFSTSILDRTAGQNTKPCASLHTCAKAGDVDRLKQLLQQTTQIDLRDEFDETPLFIAVRYDKRDTAALLISAGANVNTRTKDGTTPLMMAVLGQDLSLITALVNAGADVNTSDANGNTFLMHGAVFGVKQTTTILRYLVAHGANVNAIAKDGWTALIWSIRSNSIENVRCLLSLGARVNAKDNKGLSAFDHVADIREISPNNAARKLQRQMRKILFAAGATH